MQVTKRQWNIFLPMPWSWPMILTRELDIDSVKVVQCAKQVKGHLVKKSSSGRTDTHNAPFAPPGPLKRSVTTDLSTDWVDSGVVLGRVKSFIKWRRDGSGQKFYKINCWKIYSLQNLSTLTNNWNVQFMVYNFANFYQLYSRLILQYGW